MANPVLNDKTFRGLGTRPADAPFATAEELDALYNRPAAGDGARPVIDRMTVDDAITKTASLFVILLLGAAAGWILTPSIPALPWIGLVAGFVLGLVNAFRKEPNVGLIVAYAAAEGLFVGGVSMFFEFVYPGIVFQAVIGTLLVFGVVLALFRSGKVRVSAKANKIFMIAMISYGLFALVNLVLVWTGTMPGFGIRSVEIAGIPLGLIIGGLAILMASYALVQDFDFIQRGAEQGVPRKYGWTAAFGLTMTLVWLYIEILRILAILRQD